MVGGPGTGKTTALVEAVAARVAEGVDPANILVLTFGRRAAAALRNRIEARIGRSTGPGHHVRAGRAHLPGVRVRPAPAGRRRAGRAGPAAAHRVRAGRGDPRAARRPRRGRPLAGRRCARRCGPGRSRPSCATCCCGRPSAGSAPRTLASLGRAHRRPDWVAAADFLAEYVAGAGAAGRDRPAAAWPTTRPSWSGRPRCCWSTTPDLLAAERDALPARLCRRAGRHRPGPDRPARPDRRRRRARGRASATRTRRRSRSAAATRPGCATSPSGSRPRAATRRPG